MTERKMTEIQQALLDLTNAINRDLGVMPPKNYRSIWHPAEENPNDGMCLLLVQDIRHKMFPYCYFSFESWDKDIRCLLITKWAYASDLNNAVVPEEE